MINNKFTRRKFLNFAKLSVLLLLTSCRGLSKKISIGFYKKFFPASFIKSFPKNWEQKDLNYKEDNLNKHLTTNDLILINDGWLSRVDFENFNNISDPLLNYLDDRAKNYLSNWGLDERKKIYPIGVVPYAIIVKNNYLHKIKNKNNWDFLLSKDLTGKMILPNSPRILLSIAERINIQNPIKAMINQDNIYDDKNAIDWLINTDAVLAILPLTICKKYLNIDSRLSIFFPNQGVPLMWNFLLINKKFNQTQLLNWIDKLLDKNIFNKLIRDGFYLPFDKKYIIGKNKNILEHSKFSNGPSEKCWQNSWSFNYLEESEKIQLEKIWQESLTP